MFVVEFLVELEKVLILLGFAVVFLYSIDRFDVGGGISILFIYCFLFIDDVVKMMFV